MKETKFERNNHTIKDLETGKREVFKSANKAKWWSRKKQMELDGGLGLGSVQIAQ